MRNAWAHDVAQKLQGAVRFVQFGERDEARRGLEQAVAMLSPPDTAAERVLLRGLLLEFACRSVATLHGRAHRRRTGPCELVDSALPAASLGASARDPRDAFSEWVGSFFAELDRVHPQTAAERASAIVRHGYEIRQSASAMARRLHVTPSLLRRSFLKEFGLPLRRYLELVRVQQAMHLMAGGKIEAVALQVGYRSKKSLYRAFRSVVGLTPVAFRELSSDGRRVLLDSGWFKRQRVRSEASRLRA